MLLSKLHTDRKEQKLTRFMIGMKRIPFSIQDVVISFMLLLLLSIILHLFTKKVREIPQHDHKRKNLSHTAAAALHKDSKLTLNIKKWQSKREKKD
jgi:hypothetical protein